MIRIIVKVDSDEDEPMQEATEIAEFIKARVPHTSIAAVDVVCEI